MGVNTKSRNMPLRIYFQEVLCLLPAFNDHRYNIFREMSLLLLYQIETPQERWTETARSSQNLFLKPRSDGLEGGGKQRAVNVLRLDDSILGKIDFMPTLSYEIAPSAWHSWSWTSRRN